ncbi:hypothetical protein MUP59_08185 [Candidatus Bathyarchaeota archaeon]|nr:hypothetical protein [Candidatus Bathyarchaeota archaeon]
MDFNQFVHEEGLTAEREEFWRFVHVEERIKWELDKDNWRRLLAQFEEQKPQLTILDESSEFTLEQYNAIHKPEL